MNLAGADPILAAVIRSSLDCLIVTDEAGRVVEFNSAAEATFGYRREFAIGRSIVELVVPEQHQSAHAEGMARYLAGGEPRVLGRRIEVEAQRADGSVFPAELAITEAWAGGDRFFTASLRDVSEHRAVEAALRASEARLSAFFHHVPASVYVKDAQGRYVVANADIARRLGRRQDELIGRRARDVAPPEIAARVESIEREVARTGRPQIAEQSFVLPGGVTHALATHFPLPDEEGNMTHIGAVLVDVTTQKLAEMQMRESEARLAAFMDHAPVAMYLKEVDGRYVVVNRRMDEVVVSAAGAILGHTTPEVFNPVAAAFIAEADRRVIETGTAEIREEHYEGADDFRHAFTTRFPVRDVEGRITHIGGVLIDITSQKAAEAELARSREALHQAEKISALGSLLAGISHELNNPLSAVIGQATMLEEDAFGTPFADRAERIRLAAARCARIVQVFLAMARQNAPQRAWIQANDVVRDALELVAYGLRASGVTVTCDLSDDLPRLWADADQLHQVLVNLLVNGQHALEGHHGPKRITVRTYLGSTGAVTIEVADTGPGIVPDVAKRIFDPFFTTKPQGVGTGLGLSFSLGLVNAHGGRLQLVEREEPGALFQVELPTSPPGNERPPTGAPPVPARRKSRGQALVVDDEPEVAEALREMLERDGYEVEVAMDGALARTRLQLRDFDIIVSDIRMPGLNGAELFDWIERERPTLRSRVGFVTGDTLGPLAGDFLKRTRAPYIEKPFSPASLRQLVVNLRPPAGD